MILYTETMSGNESKYIINSINDFTQLYDLYPQVEDIVHSSFRLEDALDKVVKYLSAHWMHAWIETGTKSQDMKLQAIKVDQDVHQPEPLPEVSGDESLGFESQLNGWFNRRDQQQKELMPRRHIQRDPGRQHDDSKDRPIARTPQEELELSIKDANKK